MKLATTRFGTISVQSDTIIHMPQGMPGFRNQKKFVLLPHREDSPFQWYQSVDEPSLAFVVTDPLWFKPDYTLDMNRLMTELPWNETADDGGVELYVIVKIPSGSPKLMTANLMGPILLNVKTRQAVQVVLSDGSYSHRFPLV